MPQNLGAALALPAAFVLLLLPGLAFLALLRPKDRERLALDEQFFLAGAISVAMSSWVALLLAELGKFSTVTAALVELGAIVVMGVVAHFLGVGIRVPFARSTSTEALWPSVVVLALAFVLHARPSEYIVGGRDPGAYVSAMGVIARTGAITHLDPVVASIPREDLSLFYANLDEQPFRFTLDVNEDKPQPS